MRRPRWGVAAGRVTRFDVSVSLAGVVVLNAADNWDKSAAGRFAENAEGGVSVSNFRSVSPAAGCVTDALDYLRTP